MHIVRNCRPRERRPPPGAVDRSGAIRYGCKIDASASGQLRPAGRVRVAGGAFPEGEHHMKAMKLFGSFATVAALAFTAGCGGDDGGGSAGGGGGGGGGGAPKLAKKDTYKVGFAQTE